MASRQLTVDSAKKKEFINIFLLMPESSVLNAMRQANNYPCAWINAGPPSTSYVALLGQLSPSGIGVHMLPSSEEFHDLGLALFRAGGGGQGDGGDDLQEKNNDKRTMMTTIDCSGRGRRNAKGRWKRNIIAIGWRWGWHGRMSCRLPPLPVVGRHHLREEGCGSETLFSCGDVDVDKDNGANEDGWFQMNVPPLII
jgi:hypothetical protein